jgi:hypothetical protein
MDKQGYDYLLTLPVEVNYIWRKPLSPITFLFYAIRYMPFADDTVFLLRKLPWLTFIWRMKLYLHKDKFLRKPSPSLCHTLYEFNNCKLFDKDNIAFLCQPPDSFLVGVAMADGEQSYRANKIPAIHPSLSRPRSQNRRNLGEQ